MRGLCGTDGGVARMRLRTGFMGMGSDDIEGTVYRMEG
jgi:hypothetical protein